LEQPARETKQLRTDRRPFVTAIDHRLEPSSKVRPAILVLRDPIIAGESVADDHLLSVGPQDRPGHVGTPVVGDLGDG